MTSSFILLAARPPPGAMAPVIGIVGIVAFLWLKGSLFRSVKLEGCLQPLLWLLIGLGTVALLTGGSCLAISEFSKSDPRFTQDGLTVLIFLGVIAGVGALLWIARSMEGERIVHMVWLFYRVGAGALVLTLFVLYILFGLPRHH